MVPSRSAVSGSLDEDAVDRAGSNPEAVPQGLGPVVGAPGQMIKKLIGSASKRSATDAPGAGRLHDVRRHGRYHEAHATASGRNALPRMLPILPTAGGRMTGKMEQGPATWLSSCNDK